jgi:hypothetical protein
MDIFKERIAKLADQHSFFKLCLLKIFYNLASSKFQIFIVCIVFFCLHMIDQNAFLIACGIYSGANVMEGLSGVINQRQNYNNSIDHH